MMKINRLNLTWIGEGANGKVYKYNGIVSGLAAVVKITNGMRPKSAIENYELLKHTGVLLPAFMKECMVDGEPAVLMEDLFTENKVYVSSNSVFNGHTDNHPEDYLLKNKLNDIANVNDLLNQLKDLVYCTNEKGIKLDMDMISFGVDRGNKNSDVYYKLVDIDAMLHDPFMSNKLYEINVNNAKKAIILFVKYFVETEDVKQRLVQQINDFEW